ncbi:MAG: hypothetical protein AAGD34_07215 [Pseudomonadota bacterium]
MSERGAGLVISVHVPKTAGTRFGSILKARHGSRVAFYYGKDSPLTHPLARRAPGDFDAGMIEALEADGITILHGHVRVTSLVKAVPDPSRYWVWLREPIEQTISHYHFLKKATDNEGYLARTIRDNDLSLEAFAAHDKVRSIQTRILSPFAVADLGFVGVTELFAPMLPLLGLSDRGRRANTNPEKPLADQDVRRALAPLLTEDIALYSEAMERAVRRLGLRKTSGLAHLLPWRP